MTKPTHIAWIDVETNGVDFDSDLLSVAMIITDMTFNDVSEPFEAVVRMSEKDAYAAYDRANDYVKRMHNTAGLWSKLSDPESCRPLHMIDTEMVDLMREVNPKAGSMIIGANVARLDQNMLQRYLPKTYAHLGYHTFDISPIAIFAQTQYNIAEFTGYSGSHNALTDVREAIEEAKYYRQAFVDHL